MLTVGVGVAQGFALVMSTAFLCYVAAIVVPYLQRKRDEPGDPRTLCWHLFVPCRDEAVVLDDTLATLRTRFPTAHVWVVDDDSRDATASVAAEWADRDRMVHLVSRRPPHARQGKGEALNAAYQALCASLPAGTDPSTVVVGVIDADGRPAPDCLDVCAGPRLFTDPDVAAVQVGVRMGNRHDTLPLPGRGRFVNLAGRALVRVQDLEFRTAISALQLVRTRTRTVGLGGNGQFTRLSALARIDDGDGRPWRGLLLEDYELSLHLLLAGLRTEYTMDTYVEQEGLPHLGRLIRQRTRWGQGTMQCGRYLPQVWASPHISTLGAVEAGYYLLQPWLQLLGTFIYPVPLILLAWSAITEPVATGAYVASAAGWPLMLFYALVGIAPFALWGPIYRARCEPGRTRGRSLVDGLAFTGFILGYYVTSWWAVARIARGRHGWAKTRRNAEIHSSGPSLSQVVPPVLDAVSRPTTIATDSAPSPTG